MNIKSLLTEKRNPNTINIDQSSSLDIIKMINEEDQSVAFTVQKILPTIARVIDRIVDRAKKGGRIFYIGAGTSGRLGILDASECPPTYSTNPDFVQAIIAGGETAILHAVEGAEDNVDLGANEIAKRDVTSLDTVIGIAASGRTPFTIGAMKEATQRGAFVASITCSPQSPMQEMAEEAMVAEVGPEVVTGSTRMKAGTAQKMILNMISTAVMIRLGKVYENLMIDVKPSNEKLQIRAQHIIQDLTGAPLEVVKEKLAQYQSVKLSILSLRTNLENDELINWLDAHDGHLRQALDAFHKNNSAS
ncbi:N-acetylmuramic acid 6-phosphate etherase [Priestia koreensis]|uniref:N-acetylmuramic acid 6-phosphate etherase n=1 Tax=Priestia koreensis TaxID=284581 RepID=UPI0028F6E9AD|nr:N-acetylmuramic acid 6-phosphate etherase [Priestia koreensis]